MKRWITTLLLVTAIFLLLGTLTAGAAEVKESGTCGQNLTWTLDSEGTLTISGSGEMGYTSWSSAVKASIKNVVIEDGVTNIGDSAFIGCSALTSITIPDSVTSIGNSAFDGCTALTSITIGNGVESIGDYAFNYCTGLKSITLPDSVPSIGSHAFDHHTINTVYLSSVESWINFWNKAITVYGGRELTLYLNGELLTDLVIPEGITNIGRQAFYGCTGLMSVTIPDSVMGIDEEAFCRCTNLKSVTIGNGVESIGSYAFYNSSLTSVTIPDNVTSIGENAFGSCASLTSVTIGNGVTNIGKQAFGDCTGLTGVTIGEAVTNIGDRAFRWCSSLTSITIPDSVTSIGNSAFYGCTALTSITIGEGVTNIGDSAFFVCSGLTSITIPDSVTSIGWGAFSECSSLLNVTIGKGVTSIETTAFPRCAKIWVDANNTAYSNDENGALFNKSKTALICCPSGFSGAYVIPESVTSIGGSAFSGCQGLTDITISDSVTSIGNYAFNGCSGLTSITIPDSVTSIGNYAFNGCSGLTSIRYNANAASIGSGVFRYAGILSEGVEVVVGNAVATIPANLFKSEDSSVPIKSITFGSGVKSIAASSFAGCSGIGSIFFTGNAPAIGDNAFGGVDAVAFYPAESATWASQKSDYGGTLYWVPYDPEKEIVASGICGENIVWQLDRGGVLNVKGSGELAGVSLWSQFRPMITEIVFSDAITMTEIPASAFLNYTRLTAITLPTGIERIGGFAFSNCTALTSITVPDDVTSLGSSAFSGCTALKAVAFLGKKPSVASDAFLNVTAVAYYPEDPADDTSWPQGGPLDGYGGRLTWRPWYTLGSDLLCEHVLTDTVVAPSCSWGYTLHKCACGYSYRSDFEPGLGTDHDYIDHAAKAATCTEVGWNAYRTCSRCDYTTYREIPAPGHDWGTPTYVWSADNGAITATHICRRDTAHKETEKGKVSAKVTKEATYDAKGEITYTATFTNPAFRAQVKTVTTPKLGETKPTENPFTDVGSGMYYTVPVLWAVENRVTAGTSATTFAPNDTCTRGQIVTFLWRAAGEPKPSGTKNPFTDVKQSDYWYDAVLWAVEQGITAGTSATTFSPNEGCTRGQVATFLWRYENKPTPAAKNPFEDVKIGAYYYDAVLWAVEADVTKGTSATTFAPNDTCTRGQIVTFLYRDIA